MKFATKISAPWTVLASLATALLPAIPPASLSAAPAAPAQVITGDFDHNNINDVRIIGTNAAERIVILDLQSGESLIGVDGNNDGDFFDAVDVALISVGFVDLIEVLAGGGNDIVEYSISVNIDNVRHDFRIDLGSGNDTVRFQQSTGQFMSDCHISFTILGGAGNDNLDFENTQVSDSRLAIDADLGVGNDTASLRFFGTMGAGVVDAKIALGAGTNSCSTRWEIVPGIRTDARVRVEGGVGKDTVVLNALRGAGETQEFEFTANLGKGDDVFDAHVALDTFELLADADTSLYGRFAIIANGGEGKDRLNIDRSFNGVPSGGSALINGLLDVNFDGGLGDDTLIANLGPIAFQSAAAAPFANERTVRFRFSGGAGKDNIQMTWGDVAGFDSVYDVIARGEAGDDNFDINVTSAGTPDLGALGFLLFDGGAGIKDLSDVASNVAFRARNFEPNGPPPLIPVGTDVLENFFIDDSDGSGESVVRYLGSSAGEIIKIRFDNNTQTTITVDRNGDGDLDDEAEGSVLALTLTRFSLSLGSGNDQVVIESNGTLLNLDRAVEVDLGVGDDLLTLQNMGSFGTGSHVTIDCVGGVGNDTITGALPTILNATAILRCDMGIGDDSVDLDCGFHNNGRLELSVNLGIGANTFRLLQGSVVAVGSRIVVNVAGGKDSDLVVCSLDNDLQSDSEFIGRVDLGAGDDELRLEINTGTVDIADSPDDGSTRLDFRARGGLGNDKLLATRVVDGVPGGVGFVMEGLLTLEFEGNEGDDELQFNTGAFTLRALSGQSLRQGLFVRLDGGAGNDDLEFVAGEGLNPYESDVDVELHGGAGNDLLTSLGNFPNAFFGKGKRMFLDGGAGVDAAFQVDNISQVLIRNCEN